MPLSSLSAGALPAPPPRPTARVLVVDDDPATAALVRHRLERAGHAVDVCDEGDEALARARDTPYDLVVAHTLLAGLDGFSLVRRLREAGHPARVVLVGAQGDEMALVRALQLGADDYLAKPFSPVELLARVGRVLARPAP